MEAGGLHLNGGGFFGETGATQQIPRRDVSVTVAEDRSEEDR
ncbi:MAG: hypothetical protein ACI8XO_000497 [Verrucomicrobiales bacterium]